MKKILTTYKKVLNLVGWGLCFPHWLMKNTDCYQIMCSDDNSVQVSILRYLIISIISIVNCSGLH